jgi:uncharacterized membrane protein YccC
MAETVKDPSPAGPLRERQHIPWHPRWRPTRPSAPPGWLPTWSVPAAMRAVRATLVMPGLFALTAKVIGDPQMTLFAVFGSFATLVLVSFGGTRRNKAVAHLGLALTGSAALVIGTLVSNTAWLAAVVTIPVAFAIFFAGVASPNAQAGVLGALLIYILPACSPAAASTIGPRLAGWWLASVVGTVAVLLLSPKPPGNKLRARAAQTATALATYLEAAVGGTATAAHREAVLADRHELKTAFASGPIRPTGLATTDQALANVVELLQWSATLTCDALDGHLDLTHAAAQDRELLAAAAGQLTATAALLRGQDPSLDVDRVRRASAASAAHQQKLAGDPAEVRAAAALAAHAQSIAVAAQAVLADALITSGKASPDLVEAERRRWYGLPDRAGPRRGSGLARAAGFLARHASLRSVWFRNSARGSVAIAAAVAVASLSGVEHGFWVALGTLSVLRTTAASTGSTAFRALLGTAVGFVAGALLLLAIGTGPAALWTVLPFAVFIASYAPGTAPFAVGQAAFTVTIVVIFNLLAPAGWQVGLLRIEDVAIGCAVSLVVGAAFWPRGAAAIVGDDLADAFRQGGRYLTQAVDWALGLRRRPPESAVAAVNAGARLDEALRAYLAEQGTKRLATEDLWALIMGTARLRLTAYAVASLPASGNGSHEQVRSDADPDLVAFRRQTADLASFYDRLAAQVGPPGHAPPAKEVLAAPDGPDYPNGVACAGNTPPRYRPDMLWVGEHLYHLAERGQGITEPAEKVAEARQLPWWR